MAQEIEISKHSEYERWHRAIKDSKTKMRISVKIDRMKVGNFGNSSPVGEGVSELKLDFGPGYRVYYLQKVAGEVVVLLCGGDKSDQQSDIKKALKLADQVRNL